MLRNKSAENITSSRHIENAERYSWLKTLSKLLLLFAFFNSGIYSASEATSRVRIAGRVLSKTGTVEAVSESNQTRQLVQSEVFFPGETIRTTATSSVRLRMTDTANIALGCNSAFKISRYHFEKNSHDIVELHLMEGSFRTITGWIGSQNRDAYKFRVADTKVEVRGTDFEVHLQANGKVYFANYNGGITISNTFGSLDLGIGGDFDFAVIEPKQAPSGLRNPPQPLLNNSLPILTPLSQQTSCT